MTLMQGSIAVPSLPRRLAAATRALCHLAIEPRMEFVSDLTDALCIPSMARMAGRLEADAEGRRLLAERPRLDSKHVDFEALAAMPDGTLGREFVRFLRGHGISPDSFRHPVDYFEDVPAYVTLRLRQTHDLWHLLTGYPPTTCGELVLSAFIFAQVGAPSSLLVALLGPIRYGFGEKRLKRRIVAAYRRGRATSRLTSFFWEEHWAEPLDRVRERVGCPAA
jgi:ubiquinone biosynthesis protein COQ4